MYKGAVREAKTEILVDFTTHENNKVQRVGRGILLSWSKEADQ